MQNSVLVDRAISRVRRERPSSRPCAKMSVAGAINGAWQVAVCDASGGVIEAFEITGPHATTATMSPVPRSVATATAVSLHLLKN